MKQSVNDAGQIKRVGVIHHYVSCYLSSQLQKQQADVSSLFALMHTYKNLYPSASVRHNNKELTKVVLMYQGKTL